MPALLALRLSFSRLPPANAYTTVPDPATEAQQKTDIANLYKTVNVNNDKLTFDGKIKFD